MLKKVIIASFLLILCCELYSQVLVGTLTNGMGGVSLTGNSGALSNGLLYLPNPSNNRIEIFDVSNPSNPTPISYVRDGDSGASLVSPTAIGISGNYAYVACVNGLEVINIADPWHPIHAGYLALSSYPSNLSDTEVQIFGTHAIVGPYRSTSPSFYGYLIIDISTPTTPSLMSSYTPQVGYGHFAISGNYGYLFGQSRVPNPPYSDDIFSSIEIVNLTNLYSPQFVMTRFFTSPESVEGFVGTITVSNNKLYVSAYQPNHQYVQGWDIFNVTALYDLSSNPSNPPTPSINHNSDLNLFNTQAITTSGNYLLASSTTTFAPGGYSYLQIIDVSAPSWQKYSTTRDLQAQNIKTQGNYAYLFSGSVKIVQLFPPVVTSFSQACGVPGDVITITGQNFSPIAPQNIVKFNGVSAPVTTGTATSLTVTVPAGATTGPISVILNGQVGTSNSNFTITGLSSSLSPPPICSGTTFNYTPASTISGAAFSWSRAVVTGISQGASSGTGSVSEVLTNTTSSPINVTYLYTTTANGCSSSPQGVVVQVNPAATITSQPSTASQTVCTSGTLSSLSITASGISPLTYQWYRNTTNSNSGGTLITGATSSTYTPSSATAGTTYYYYVQVTNGCGVMTPSSPSGAINVLPIVKAAITYPNGLNVCSGNVVLTGSNFYPTPPTTYNYSWSSGETTQSIYPTTAGSFTVTVSNACGTSTATVTTTKSPSNCNTGGGGGGARVAASNPSEQPIIDADLPDVNELTAYPNPATDVVTIAVPTIAKEDTPVLLYNFFGDLVVNKSLRKGEWQTTVPLTNCTEGIYIVRVGNGDLASAIKVIVTRK